MSHFRFFISGVILVLFRCSVPGAPPKKVGAKSLNSTAILVQWDEVPIEKQHGEIISYTVFYWKTDEGSQGEKSTSVHENQVQLSGLGKYTKYSIEVRASTIKGGGPRSNLTTVRTNQDSE